MTATFESAYPRLKALRRYREFGRVSEVVGIVIEANGPQARIGDLCQVESSDGWVSAEVVGFRDERVLLMPLGELSGVKAGSLVESGGTCLRVPVGDGLLGRTLDGLGRPMDGLGPLECLDSYPVYRQPPNALERQLIDAPLATGVRAIDGLLTLGLGQRMGVFSGSGVGKSTLLGMVARDTAADVSVIALIGERGRELREFIAHELGPEGLAKCVLVCATSDQPALVRIKAAFTATAIAEWYRDQGRSVMLMMDSVTRFAMAQREVGLAVGEPPSSKGYTPSVFSLLPKLMERAGRGETGSITALYSVLVEGDDASEPISDACRAILDGHIFLSRKLTSKGHYPPIDVLESLSRVMPLVVTETQLKAAHRVRELIAARDDIDDLVSIGAYKVGTKPLADEALEKGAAIERFLRQGKGEQAQWEATQEALKEIAGE